MFSSRNVPILIVVLHVKNTTKFFVNHELLVSGLFGEVYPGTVKKLREIVVADTGISDTLGDTGYVCTSLLRQIMTAS